MVPHVGQWYKHKKSRKWGKIIHVKTEKPSYGFEEHGNVYHLTLRMTDGSIERNVAFQHGYDNQELKGGRSRILRRKSKRDPSKVQDNRNVGRWESARARSSRPHWSTHWKNLSEEERKSIIRVLRRKWNSRRRRKG